MSALLTSDPARRLRVALLGANLNRSGAEKQLFYIARSLAAAGVDVRLYMIVSGGYFDRLLQDAAVEVHCFGKVPYPPLRLAYLALQMMRFRPHVIQSIPAFMNVYAALAGRITGAVTIGGLRSDFGRCREQYGWITPWLMKSCDAIAVNSRKARQDLTNSGIVPPERVHLLRNGVDMAPFTSCVNKAAEQGDFVALFVGRFIPAKRVDVYLGALAEARKRNPLIRGIIAGDGPETQNMRDLAASLNLTEAAVTFLGHHDDIEPLFGQSNCLVLSSDSEGCPNVVLEAMAAGLPVIATPAGDAPDMVQDGHTGLMVPFGDSGAIANALVYLFENPAICRSFGRAGCEYVRRVYAVSDIAERALSIYQHAAGRKGGLWPPLKPSHHGSAKVGRE